LVDTIKRVTELAAEIFEVPASDLSPQAGPEQVATWDSTAHMRLMARLEEEFDISLDIEEVVEMLSIQKIAETVQKKRAA
jgi:acyl carrier protein